MRFFPAGNNSTGTCIRNDSAFRLLHFHRFPTVPASGTTPVSRPENTRSFTSSISRTAERDQARMIKNRVRSGIRHDFLVSAFGYRKHKRLAAIGSERFDHPDNTCHESFTNDKTPRNGKHAVSVRRLAESIPVSANGLPVAEAPATASASTKQTTQHNDKGHPAMNEAITIRIRPSSHSWPPCRTTRPHKRSGNCCH